MSKRILIVDDEPGICSALTLALEDRYEVTATTSPLEGLRLFRSQCMDVCLVDLRIGNYDGIALLEQMKEYDENAAVILMTAYSSIKSAVDAIKRGAYSYITKPLNTDELVMVIEQALKYRELNERVQYLSRELEHKYEYSGIVGRSPAMRNVFTLIEKLKDVDTTVLITGESGTGKELVAKALHYSGRRKGEYFAEVNCGAIPEGLLEEELFGHKKGAFTGAVEDRKGKFEFADKGSLFLDEIGDMPPALQAKLLRVLQEKEVTPIGSNEQRPVDVRIIAATNKDLQRLVQEGRFRQDLYFRLNVVEIKMPALRDKKQDLPLFFAHYIKKYALEFNRPVTGLSKEVERLLMRYDYPGNVRELGNILQYAVLMCEGDTISIGDLPESVTEAQRASQDGTAVFTEDLVGLPLREVEKRVIAATLARQNGHRKRTAEILGISEKGLRNKIAEYGIG
jgi:two-component system response regulator AtoC